jgi:hypothetical protein
VAERVHGVVFTDEGAAVDIAATARRREAILTSRRQRRPVRERDMPRWLAERGIRYEELKPSGMVSDFLEIRSSSSPGVAVIGCVACGSPLCAADENLREYVSRSGPIPPDFLSPVNVYRADPAFR